MIMDRKQKLRLRLKARPKYTPTVEGINYDEGDGGGEAENSSSNYNGIYNNDDDLEWDFETVKRSEAILFHNMQHPLHRHHQHQSQIK